MLSGHFLPPLPPDHSDVLQTSTEAERCPKLVGQRAHTSNTPGSGSEGAGEGVGGVRPSSLDGENLCLQVAA